MHTNTFTFAGHRSQLPSILRTRLALFTAMQITKTLLTAAATVASFTTGIGAANSNCALVAQLKVMSFNLRTSIANDPCPSGCWDQRKERVRQLVAKYTPDLIGTQEGAPDQIAFFESQLGYASTGECAGNCQWEERNSIFYRSDRWELLKTSTFALSDTPDVLPSNTWNLEYTRAAVIARFRNKITSNEVCMLNTHYDISRGQVESSKLVAQRMNDTCTSGDTVLLTGDLNTIPESAAIQYLTGEIAGSPIPLYKTLTAAGAGGPTWIGGSFGTVPATGVKLDYILARRNKHTCLRKGSVLDDLFDGFSSSDHAVLMSEFCLGEKCSNCIA